MNFSNSAKGGRGPGQRGNPGAPRGLPGIIVLMLLRGGEPARLGRPQSRQSDPELKTTHVHEKSFN
jgi:hypothetical protein